MSIICDGLNSLTRENRFTFLSLLTKDQKEIFSKIKFKEYARDFTLDFTISEVKGKEEEEIIIHDLNIASEEYGLLSICVYLLTNDSQGKQDFLENQKENFNQAFQEKIFPYLLQIIENTEIIEPIRDLVFERLSSKEECFSLKELNLRIENTYSNIDESSLGFHTDNGEDEQDYKLILPIYGSSTIFVPYDKDSYQNFIELENSGENLKMIRLYEVLREKAMYSSNNDASLFFDGQNSPIHAAPNDVHRITLSHIIEVSEALKEKHAQEFSSKKSLDASDEMIEVRLQGDSSIPEVFYNATGDV